MLWNPLLRHLSEQQWLADPLCTHLRGVDGNGTIQFSTSTTRHRLEFVLVLAKLTHSNGSRWPTVWVETESSADAHPAPCPFVLIIPHTAIFSDSLQSLWGLHIVSVYLSDLSSLSTIRHRPPSPYTLAMAKEVALRITRTDTRLSAVSYPTAVQRCV